MTIFSRIIAGESPCYKVAENDRFFAFLDINPLAKGHTLVVPKQEVDYLYDLDDDTLLYAHRSAKMCRPASVLKLLTAGVALERLGADYSICTTLGVSADAGCRNLLLRGEMDPLFSEQDLDAMVAAVEDSSVVDTLFVDCSFMDSIYWGPGWSWDDTPWEFQPYMSPLMLNGG